MPWIELYRYLDYNIKENINFSEYYIYMLYLCLTSSLKILVTKSKNCPHIFNMK